MSEVLYLNDIKGDSYEIVQTRHTPQDRSVTGYGGKRPTSYMVIDNHSKRKYRVYVMIYSNSGSSYVIIGGIKYFIRDSDVPERPRVIGLPDKRYTIGREFCGDASPRLILRFCGTWLSKHDTREEAETAAGLHHANLLRGTHGTR